MSIPCLLLALQHDFIDWEMTSSLASLPSAITLLSAVQLLLKSNTAPIDTATWDQQVPQRILYIQLLLQLVPRQGIQQSPQGNLPVQPLFGQISWQNTTANLLLRYGARVYTIAARIRCKCWPLCHIFGIIIAVTTASAIALSWCYPRHHCCAIGILPVLTSAVVASTLPRTPRTSPLTRRLARGSLTSLTSVSQNSTRGETSQGI